MKHDGAQHIAQAADDVARNAFVVTSGFRLWQFWNNAVLEELDSVVKPSCKFCGVAVCTITPGSSLGARGV
ncbi:MAG: DUF559 domain-containing protein [Burkholderiales bacterium]